MAVKKPLVMGSNGFPQQLQAGDSIDAVETGQITLTATSTTVAGQVGYADGDDSFDLARANATGTTKAICVATANIAAAASGQVQVNGILALTTGQWDAVAGTTGGLVFNTDYFLSAATAGMMTATPTTTVGQTVQCIGRAISTTELSIRINDPILL